MARDLDVPDWAAPRPAEVVDCARIATAVADTDPRIAAIATAVAWACGDAPAPVSGWTGPVDKAAARTEMWIAEHIGGAPYPDLELWAAMGLPPRDAVVEDPVWATGAAASLGWLLGTARKAPIRLPARGPDGSVPTAEELYRAAVQAQPHRMWTPEQRRAARAQAARDAALHQRLAALAG